MKREKFFVLSVVFTALLMITGIWVSSLYLSVKFILNGVIIFFASAFINDTSLLDDD